MSAVMLGADAQIAEPAVNRNMAASATGLLPKIWARFPLRGRHAAL
jgi:hypothetical protein